MATTYKWMKKHRIPPDLNQIAATYYLRMLATAYALCGVHMPFMCN